MVKVDLKDRRILHELDHNARTPFSKIGRKIGLSESVVRYRIERLQSLGVLNGFMTFIDSQKVGYRDHNVFIKLKVISERKERELVERLKRLSGVCWLVSTSGHYNLVLGVLARDVQHFQEVLNDVMHILENCIVEDSLLISTSACQLQFPLIPNQKRDFTMSQVKIGGSPIRLSLVDVSILQGLSGDARISTLELAKKLDLSFSAVSEHLNKLISSHLIQGFKPWIDMSKLGKQWYLVLLKLKYIDLESSRAFIESLKGMPQTFFIVCGVGNWSMQVEFFCDDDCEFREVMNKIFPSHKSDIIKEHTELRISKEHKCIFYPVGLSGEAVQTSLDSWCKKRR